MSNRLALDDDDTEVTVDRRRARIVVRRSRGAADGPVADLLFLAEGVAASGDRVPFSIHLKIFRKHGRLKLDLHRHLRTQTAMVTADFEPFDVVVTDGETDRIVLTPTRSLRLCRRPSLALRVVKSLMAMQDNLAGLVQDPTQPGARVADITVGFGALGLRWMMARAALRSLEAANGQLLAGRSVVDMLTQGTWELSLQCLARRWIDEVIKRDLFLFGLDDLPLLAPVRERGLSPGEALVFRFRRGEGHVLYGSQSVALPRAIDVARDYLEFHLLGGLLIQAAETPTWTSPQ